MTTVIDHIRIDDLPDDCRQIAEIIGMEALLKLVSARGGESFYIPKAERVALAARNRAIRAAFDGRNHAELAHRFGLTVTWIRAILGGSGEPSEPSPPDESQKQLPLL